MHNEETLKAAEHHVEIFRWVPADLEERSRTAFLAGYDHRQKEMNELKESVKELSDILENYIWLMTSDETGEIYPEYRDFPVKAIEHAKQAIQKHKQGFGIEYFAGITQIHDCGVELLTIRNKTEQDGYDAAVKYIDTVLFTDNQN